MEICVCLVKDLTFDILICIKAVPNSKSYRKFIFYTNNLTNPIIILFSTGAYTPEESQQGGGTNANSESAPNEVLFLPLMKKALRGQMPKQVCFFI